MPNDLSGKLYAAPTNAEQDSTSVLEELSSTASEAQNFRIEDNARGDSCECPIGNLGRGCLIPNQPGV